MVEWITSDLLVPADIGIVGYGIVGQAIARSFEITSKGSDRILFYDKYKKSQPLDQVASRCEFIFVCLPTPMKKDESDIDLSIIDEVIDQLTPITNYTNKVVVIKSTCVPGSTENYEKLYPQTHFAFNPEFLTEANPMKDFLVSTHHIIGASNDLVSRRLSNFYQHRFPNSEIFQTDTITAECVKYFRNDFLAVRVAYGNLWFDYCEAKGVKYEEVKKLASLDPRIGDFHFDVTTRRGFGGKCLPKDLVATIADFTKVQVSASLLKITWAYNKHIRKRDASGKFDWEDIPGAVEGNHNFHLTP